MQKPAQSKFEADLISARKMLLKKLESVFKERAVESHLLGSVAQKQADAFSDIDIWFTFSDDDYGDIYDNRFEYYDELGNIIHSCEPPQNAPKGGVHTALLIGSRQNIIVVVDIYLCPLSTAYIREEGRKLFGVDLPSGTMNYNSKQVTVGRDYRIDFFICFIFNTIKKLARHEQTPLKALLREYERLRNDYNIQVAKLDNQEQNALTLKRVIKNAKEVANDEQIGALNAIRDYAKNVIRYI